MSKELKEAKDKLWKSSIISWKLHKAQLDMHTAVNNSQSTIFVINSSRQLGKCLAKTDTCLTPNGPIQMQYIKPGDKVYGYNEDGSISLCNVIASESQGEKEVVDFVHQQKVIATCTKEHRWLTRAVAGKKWAHLSDKVRYTEDFYKGVLVRRCFQDIPCGTVHEPHAYAIGALLGDGCSRQTGNRIQISSENEIIPNKLGNILNVTYVYALHENNYTWALSTECKQVGNAGTAKRSGIIHCNYYEEWCKGRYAHEKIADWSVIDKWDRESCLNFLAGLIDTDGSVGVSRNILIIQLAMQAKAVIDVVEKLIFKLWQYRAPRTVDKRKRYKNGPVVGVKISQNLFSKRALKELTPYLALDRKKWKPEYENCLENNSNADYVGVKISKPYKTECWDIQVDNKTSLYLTGNGLVTHNSFFLCVFAIEYALKNPGAKISYLAPQAKMVKKIILPRIREIMRDCPSEIKPDYKVNEQVYKFKHNGSEIHIAGTDAGRAENLRGQVFHLVICDEAGFMDDLRYVVSSILVPMISTTRGRIILSSTPPVSPDHAFVSYVRQAELAGNYIKKTIYENPLIDESMIQNLIDASGGENSDAWKREYLAEFITNSQDAVLPEADEKLMSEIVQDWPRPAFFDTYTAADLGYVDNTGMVFGYWDFLAAKLIIEDEAKFNKPTSTKIAEVIKEKETGLWEINGSMKEPYKRVVDGNDITIADLNAPPHNLRFLKTRNDDPQAAINMVRVMLANKQIIIHPRCVNLISEMKSAVWDKNGKKLARSDEESRGHFDTLMSLVYLVRNVNKEKNPYPPGLGLDIGTMYVHPNQFKNQSSNFEIMKKALLTKHFERFGPGKN